MDLRRPLLVGLLAGAVSLGAVPLAHAAFRDTADGATTFTTDALAPPTAVTLSRSCPVLGLLESLSASWTPSTSAWAADQVVEIRDGNGLVLATRTLAGTESSTTFSLTLLAAGPRTVVVRTRYNSWTASASATRSC